MPRITPTDWKTHLKIFEMFGCQYKRKEGSQHVLTYSGAKRAVVIPEYDEIDVDIIKNKLNRKADSMSIFIIAEIGASLYSPRTTAWRESLLPARAMLHLPGQGSSHPGGGLVPSPRRGMVSVGVRSVSRHASSVKRRTLDAGRTTPDASPPVPRSCFAHESAFIDDGVEIGEGTVLRHVTHVLKGSRIGRSCRIGRNVVIGPNGTVGDHVKIQSDVSVCKEVAHDYHDRTSSCRERK